MEKLINRSSTVFDGFFLNFIKFDFFRKFQILKFHFLSIRGLISKSPGGQETKNNLKIV